MSELQKPNSELILYRLDQIDKKLELVTKNYVTKEEFENFRREMEIEMRRKTLSGWVNPILASVATAIITYLAIAFFDNRK